MPSGGSQSQGAESGTDEKLSNNFWSLLPSFDPSVDDIREYTQKVKFIHGVLPESQKPMLAPRLAMLCKGTAWSQVQRLESKDLTHATKGVKVLLEALAAWEETSEMRTFELFEKALYRITQKQDEATHSFNLRLRAAFDDLGDSVIQCTTCSHSCCYASLD